MQSYKNGIRTNLNCSLFCCCSNFQFPCFFQRLVLAYYTQYLSLSGPVNHWPIYFTVHWCLHILWFYILQQAARNIFVDLKKSFSHTRTVVKSELHVWRFLLVLCSRVRPGSSAATHRKLVASPATITHSRSRFLNTSFQSLVLS